MLAHRAGLLNGEVTGNVSLNSTVATEAQIRDASIFVEQEDSFIGSLTVRETVDFAARLSLPSSISKKERLDRVDALVASFG